MNAELEPNGTKLEAVECSEDRRKADEDGKHLVRSTVMAHAWEDNSGVIVCPICKYRRLHYCVDVNGSMWASCFTRDCVEIIDS